MTDTPHAGHHWGPFADDPWSPLLDLVDGPVWEEAVRHAERSCRAHPAWPVAHAPGHHSGPFADDPWSRLLDLVDGPVWEAVVRRSRAARAPVSGFG